MNHFNFFHFVYCFFDNQVHCTDLVQNHPSGFACKDGLYFDSRQSQAVFGIDYVCQVVHESVQSAVVSALVLGE